jgi:hypothetical protein
MQTIGVHIWSGFAMDPFLGHSKFLKRIEPAVGLLSTSLDVNVKKIALDTIIKASIKNLKCLSQPIVKGLCNIQEMVLLDTLLDFADQITQIEIHQENVACFEMIIQHFISKISFILLLDNVIKFRALEIGLKLISLVCGI